MTTKERNNIRQKASELAKLTYESLDELHDMFERHEECFDCSVSQFDDEDDDHFSIDLWELEEEVEIYHKLYKSLRLKIKER